LWLALNPGAIYAIGQQIFGVLQYMLSPNNQT